MSGDRAISTASPASQSHNQRELVGRLHDRLFNDSILTMVPNLQSKMRWDILKDFELVSLVATVEWGLVAGNQTSFKSAADLIAAAGVGFCCAR